MNDFQFIYDDIIPINYNGVKQKLIIELDEIFQNTKNIIIDWQIRENSIRKLGQICVGDSGKTDIFIKFFNTEIISNLAIQLADLRSSVMKEACRIVSLCGKELGNLAEPGAVHLLSRIILFKIAGSANRVIADSSSKCILNLVKHVNSVKIINNICEQKNIKSNFVRTVCTKCILYIVSCYKKNLILNKVPILQETMKYLLGDPNGDVRSIIRRAFITFKKRLPGEAENVYNTLEKNIQKQINEDERTYGNKIIINEDNINKRNFELTPIKKKIKIFYSSNKPKSHEIKVKLKEIPNIKKINYNNYNNQSEMDGSYNNYINEEEHNISKINNNISNNNIFDNKIKKIINESDNNNINIGNAYLNKNPIYKSAKGKNPVSYYNYNNQNSNTIRLNHKDVLKKLNEKFLNYNNNENENKINNEEKNENFLPPINQFYPSLNKSQNYKKNSRSVLQSNKINLKNEINNNNLAMNNNYVPIIKDNMPNIKVINNNNSIEKKVINYIDKLSMNNDINEKLEIFQFIFNNFKDILNDHKNFSNNTLRQLINIHTDNMNGNDISLIEQLLKNLMRIIYYMCQILNNNDIQLIVKLLIEKINMGEKSISNLCYKLLDLIRKKGKIEDIYNGVFNSLEGNNIKINEICYEYLAYLINRYGIIFETNNYYERIFYLINNCNINSKRIGKLIGALYKNNSENFVKLYKEENNNNQKKIVSFIESNNLDFIQDLKEKIEINKINDANNLDKTINNKIKKIVLESKINNNNNNSINTNNNITEEIKINLENGNVKLFISYIENNINYLSSFIMILSNEKNPEFKYTKNYLNFTYALISNPKFKKEISQNMKILIQQIINILLMDNNDSVIVNSIKEILYILPIKICSEKYFKEISKYLNDKSDILLLQILLGSIKNYIIYDKSKNLEKNINYFIDGILNLLDYQSSDIRKLSIYCCVEMYNILKDKFNIYFERISKNTQNIINQLIKKKYG